MISSRVWAFMVPFGVSVPLSASAEPAPVSVLNTRAQITELGYSCSGSTINIHGKFKNTGPATATYKIILTATYQGACLKFVKAPSTCTGFCPDQCVQWGPDKVVNSEQVPQTLAAGATASVSMPFTAQPTKTARLHLQEVGRVTAVSKVIGAGAACIY